RGRASSPAPPRRPRPRPARRRTRRPPASTDGGPSPLPRRGTGPAPWAGAGTARGPGLQPSAGWDPPSTTPSRARRRDGALALCGVERAHGVGDPADRLLGELRGHREREVLARKRLRLGCVAVLLPGYAVCRLPVSRSS